MASLFAVVAFVVCGINMAASQDLECFQDVTFEPCEWQQTAFVYNGETMECERLQVPEGQCTRNSFPTLEACKMSCVCSAPPEGGMCRGYFPNYHFNAETRTCESFVYGGCGGNGNRFETEAACKSTCLCGMHPHAAAIHCMALFPKVIYNSTTSQCTHYNYGGCGESYNLFDTVDECNSHCP